MLPDKVDAGWSRKEAVEGEEGQEERRRRRRRKEEMSSVLSSCGEKLTERDIYMINKGMEMEMKMRTGGVGGVGGELYGGQYRHYGQYRLQEGLMYPRNDDLG